jgi:hypothetical protein
VIDRPVVVAASVRWLRATAWSSVRILHEYFWGSKVGILLRHVFCTSILKGVVKLLVMAHILRFLGFCQQNIARCVCMYVCVYVCMLYLPAGISSRKREGSSCSPLFSSLLTHDICGNQNMCV